MDDARARDTRRLAVAVGVVAIGSAVCLATYFAVRGPFGTINDVGNATAGVLSAALAWRLRSRVTGRVGDVAAGMAVIGAALTVVGSALVVSRTTGFFLAGLVSSLGFAAIGTWLVILNRSDLQAAVWPGRLRSLGAIGGAIMALGVVAVPGILLGLDDMDTAPGWVWIAFLGWLGIFLVYPAWALWVGIVEARRSRGLLASATEGRSGEGGEAARSWTGG